MSRIIRIIVAMLVAGLVAVGGAAAHLGTPTGSVSAHDRACC
jgi:hypothetical protein